jgi:Ca-activated chloride channel family protein
MKEMTEQDWISYSRFGGDVQHELSLLQPCTADTVKRVAGLIAKTDADLGGTEMNHALLSTFQLGKGIKKLFGLSGRDDDQSADVLLITDGDIWNVEEVIASAKSSGHRVFAIGVGSAPSESLLREVAEKSGGACDLVSPNQDIASVIVRMFRRMRSVRCSNLTMAWGHDVLWQSTMPRALYGGDTIHCCARMAARPQTLPVLSWMAGGATVGYSPNKIQVLEGDWLSRMVAASQMGEFSEQISPRQRIEQSADDVSAPEALNAQALALALKYQLVTDQTNLLLVHVREENNKVNGLPDLEKIVHMQAAGWGGVGSVSSQSHQFRCGTTAYSLAINACASRINTRDLSDSDTTPRWRIRTSEAAALSVDALTSSCPDNFEIPAFLRSQVDSVGDLASPPARNTKTTKPVPRALRVDPLATPLDLLKTFENSSQKLLAPHRFVRQLQALNLPAELTSRLDDLTVMLGSGTKAWAVVLQWLAAKLSDQITLSRQSERLLRHVLKDEDAQRLQEMLVSLIGSFDQVSANDWHLGATVSG